MRVRISGGNLFTLGNKGKIGDLKKDSQVVETIMCFDFLHLPGLRDYFIILGIVFIAYF